MSFLGKLYAHDKDENHDAFIQSLGLPEDRTKLMIDFKPSVKVEKNGDEYTINIIHPGINKSLTFKNGVPFNEELAEGVTCVNTITVSGNLLTEKKDLGENHVVTLNMEFSDSQLVQTFTSNFWDGTARRYYKV